MVYSMKLSAYVKIIIILMENLKVKYVIGSACKEVPYIHKKLILLILNNHKYLITRLIIKGGHFI